MMHAVSGLERKGNKMIGLMEFEVNNIQRKGIRMTADIVVRHAWSTTEGNEHGYPLTITTELLELWGFQSSQAADAIKHLLGELYQEGVNLLSVTPNPPEHGYWFDTHNSKSSIRETKSEFINAQDHLQFLANPADTHRISGIFGGAILSELENADETIHQKTGLQLLGDLDSAFDRSLAVMELSTPPDDEKDLGHKISLLATIIDKFKGKNPNNEDSLKSIRALENWLKEKVDTETANRIVAPFDGVRGLRNQYPTHDQFDKGRKELKHVKEAEAYFGFRDIDDAATKWKKICDAFRDGINKVVDVISDASQS
jgi:hypothetical protein